jgi:hypothetical protein
MAGAREEKDGPRYANTGKDALNLFQKASIGFEAFEAGHARMARALIPRFAPWSVASSSGPAQPASITFQTGAAALILISARGFCPRSVNVGISTGPSSPALASSTSPAAPDLPRVVYRISCVVIRRQCGHTNQPYRG